MRVAILWKQLSGYASASFAALQRQGVELMVVHRKATGDAPFDDGALALDCAGHAWSEAPDEARLRSELEQFAADALLVISWDVGAYRRISRAMQGRTLRVLCMDNSWLGTPKQWAGRIASPALIRPCYDVAFLPGERQAAFARRLGFADDEILWGLYTCDHPTFAAVRDERIGEPAPAFVFAGRLVAPKGAGVLAEAYRLYRQGAADPWPLSVCGTGPMAGALSGIPGVEMLGFVQPAELPAVFARSGCLVAPSTFEPWGVVIHEAVSAGLAVVCSTACGASTRLVLDGYNGEVVPPGRPARLAEAMARVASATTDRAAISRRSGELSAQFTPQRWAQYLCQRLPALRERFGLHG
ncbi:MAG TPA: glycosyltransferase family 4 protein [Acidimicrobiales bacterium]|nr:glycosyltransferase family 4 protein [Acidimicrobiales bacterium]